MKTTEALGLAHAVVAALVSGAALLLIPVAIRIGEVPTAIAFACVTLAGCAVLAGVLRRHRGALRIGTILYGVGAFLLLQQDALVPAVVVAALFAGTVALALRASPSQAPPPPQP